MLAIACSTGQALVSGLPWTDVANAITLTSSLRQVVLESNQPGFYRLAPFVVPSGLEFVWIGPGMFTMGVGNDIKLPDLLADFDEQPPHAVTLTRGFYILKDRVSRPSMPPGFARDLQRRKLEQCGGFLRLAESAGRPDYRLPTEAEWEYVSKNPYGVTNLGRREWVNDWHQLYLNDSVTNPVGPAPGILKVIRTGAENRISLPPDATSSPWGFPGRRLPGRAGFGPLAGTQSPRRRSTNLRSSKTRLRRCWGRAQPRPYFTVRYALPLPPDNDRNQNGPLTGLDQSVVDHNHSPGFEIMPNGDALAVWFSGVDGDEYGAGVRIVQARLRYGRKSSICRSCFTRSKITMTNRRACGGRGLPTGCLWAGAWA